MDVKERLVEGMRGQAILVQTPASPLWLLLTETHRRLLAERVLAIPGIEISEVEA
jgi:hypothetical protein